MAAEAAGPQPRSLLGSCWVCGDLAALTGEVTGAGLLVVVTRTRSGTPRFASPEEFAATEVEGSPLRSRISTEVYAQLRARAREVLRPFTAADGTLPAPFRGHLVVARTPGS